MKRVRIEKVAEVNPSLPKSLATKVNRTVTFLPMVAVSEGGYIVNPEEKQLGDVVKGYRYFERGDVLLAKVTPCFENGKAAVADQIPHSIGFGSSEFHVLRPHPEVDAPYLFYMLWNPVFRAAAKRYMTGTTGLKRLPTDFIARCEIPLPPLPEQRRIAAILDKADVVRRKRREAIQLTEEFLRSAFLEMFGDPVTNPKRREMASETIADFVDIVMGQSPPGGTVSGDIGIPLLNGPTEFGPHHPTPVQFTTDARKIANPGDLLFCVRGSTGRMNWADQKYAIGRGLAAFRHRQVSELQPFVRAVIEFQLPKLLAQATGSIFPNVSASQLAAIPYPNFSMLEQRRIAAILDKADVVRRKWREAIQQHNDLFNALVQRAFRGEL